MRFEGRVWPQSVAMLLSLLHACSPSDSGPASKAAPDAGVSADAEASLSQRPGPNVGPRAKGSDTLSEREVPLDAGTGGKPNVETQPNKSAESSDPPCSADAGGPYSLLEGETITVQLRCSIAPTRRAFVLEEPPAGMTLDAASGQLAWTPSLDQAGMHDVTFREEVTGEAGSVRFHIVDRWNADDNVPVTDALSYREEHGLPVLHLTTDPTINDAGYTPATIIYRGHRYDAEAKLRGAMSQSYPKRSFTLKFAKADKFNEGKLAGGFFEKRKITLTTTFDDNSYVRQRLGYELWNRLDPNHIRVQSYSAVVFLDGAYHGLYNVIDHIDGYLMEDFGHRQDGDLYKARTHDANFRSELSDGETPKESLHRGYTKEEGMPLEGEPGAFDNLDSLITWVIDKSPADLALEAPSRIALVEYQDWWIWVSFIAADDSSGKNSYHYRDPLLRESLWHVVPWDLNQSFGQDWYTRRTPPDMTTPEDYYLSRNQLFEKLLAGPLGNDMRGRYAAALSDGAYKLDRVLELLDELAAEISESAHRDEEKWSSIQHNFEFSPKRDDHLTYDEELGYVRQWIIDRHALLHDMYGPTASQP